MLNLENKIILITGASSGIGKSCAIEFAKLKANLVLAARRLDRLEKLADELKKQYQIKVNCIELDVRNFEDVQNKFDSLDSNWKQIDILVNNAGLARGLEKVYEGKLSNWDEMIDTNLKGLLNVTRVVSPVMVEKQSGHIINIGSTAG